MGRTTERKREPVLSQTHLLWIYLRARFVDPIVPDEAGSVVETVIITAGFAALAIAIGAIIVAKVTSKANSIDLN
jgi:hypothetical protein